MGTNNKLNNAVAAMHALEYYKVGKNPKKKVVAKVADAEKPADVQPETTPEAVKE